MTINLEIPEEIEAGLIAQASAGGLLLDVFLERLLRNVAATHADGENAPARTAAVERMQEFGEKYRLSLGKPVSRALLHEGHLY